MFRGAYIVSLLVLGWVTMLPGGVTPSASAQEATPEVACPETTADEQAASARRWFEEGLNGGDFSVLDEILADDFTYHSGALPELNASELTETVLAPIRVGFPDVHYTVDEVLTGDDVVVIIWHAEGTQTGEFQGYAPTGNAARWTGINVYRFACGRVAEAWAEFDDLGRLRQMGVIGTPVP
jgi:predicted ester cyclase